MRVIWNFISRTLFWDYDRGSVPYDLMVLAVVGFVFLTPRAWFHDRPGMSAAAPAAALSRASIEQLEENAAAATRTFRIAAQLMEPTHPGNAFFERRAHEVLTRHVDALRGRKFQIVHVHSARDAGGAQYYDVTVQLTR
jgi:hypothetical protein